MIRKLEYKTIEGLDFNILFDEKKLSIVGFEFESGLDVEKLRSLQAFNFSTEAHARSIINKMIPCQRKNN